MAQFAIGALLLALIRTLAEYYRLRHVRGPSLMLDDVTPYILGGLIAALGVLMAILLYFAGRYRLAASTVGIALGVMLVYKVVVIG